MPSSNLSKNFSQGNHSFRLLVAPGVTQLISGMAAIRLYETKTEIRIPTLLAIFGLYSDRTQDFINTIQQVAYHVGVSEVIYIVET